MPMHIKNITFEWNEKKYRTQHSGLIKIYLSKSVKKWTNIVVYIKQRNFTIKARAQIEPNNGKSFIGVPYMTRSLRSRIYTVEYEGKIHSGIIPSENIFFFINQWVQTHIKTFKTWLNKSPAKTNLPKRRSNIRENKGF